MFVDMGDLVPHCLGLEEITRSKQKPPASVNGYKPLQYMWPSFLRSNVPNLIGYYVLMLEASNEYKNDCWLAYDRRFRQQNGSNINITVWNLAFTLQARANRCRHCFSLFHSSRECELAPDLATITPEPHYTRPPRGTQYCHRLICHQWNVQRTQNRSYPNCCFEHVCYFCASDTEASDIYHKAIFCPTCLNHNQQSAMPTIVPLLFEVLPLSTLQTAEYTIIFHISMLMYNVIILFNLYSPLHHNSRYVIRVYQITWHRSLTLR